MKNLKAWNVWKTWVIIMGSGLVLMAFGLAFGASTGLYIDADGVHRQEKTEISEVETGEFSAIVIDSESMNIEIIAGDEFGAELTFSKKEPYLQVEGGTLTISQRRNESRWMDFGFNFYSGDRVKVYVPQVMLSQIIIESQFGNVEISGVTAERIVASLDAGNLKMDSVMAEYAKLELDFGNITCEDVSFGGLKAENDCGNINFSGDVSGEAGLNLHLGNVVCKGASFGSLKVENDSGNIEVDGDVAGDIDISNSLGNIKVRLGEGERYYDLKTEFGNVSLFGEKGKNRIVSGDVNLGARVTVRNDSGNIIIDRDM